MKKLFTILFTLSALTISACQEKMKKYDWIPTECAPKNYPVQIFKGSFTYGEGKKVNVPSGRVVDYGWGENGSINLVGEKFKEAPTVLEIAWLSFTEKKNYGGKFILDAKKIDSLLEAGYPDDTEDNGKGNFNYIKVGMAPGGDLVLWLTGVRNKQVEIGHYQAQLIDKLDWASVYPDMEGSFDTYINNVIKDLPEATRSEILSGNIPYKYWNNLRKKYNWKITVIAPENISRLDIDYLNKERNFIFGDHLKQMDFKLSAPVEELSVHWMDDKKREIRTEIKFDEQETTGIFAKINADEKAALVVAIDAQKKEASVSLKINNTLISFKNIKVQSFYK